MTQSTKDILINLGFAVSAILTITCFIPIVVNISFIFFVVLAVLWLKRTTNGQKAFKKFCEICGGEDDIECFDEEKDENISI